MVLPRASGLSGALGRTVLRRAGAQARTRASRQIGRRTYASGHGEQQSSELPWIIGSIVVTVPAASWLWSQGPKKGDHGHGHESHGEEHEEEEEKTEEGGEEEASGDEEPKGEETKEEEEPKVEEPSNDRLAEEGKDESEEKGVSEDATKDEKSDDKEASKEEDESDDKPSPGSPGQINWSPDSGTGPGEGQKGERRPTERHRDVMAANDHSGAKHPYLDDPEKSKKGAGPTETAKIHGTVDVSKPTRGVKE